MGFKINQTKIVKNAISADLADFLFKYLILKRETMDYLYLNKLVENNTMFGTFLHKQNEVIGKENSGSFTQYGDSAMETLLTKMLPLAEEHTGLKLIPTYTLVRVYEKGSVLLPHIDKHSSEWTITLNFGGEPYPFYVDTKNNSDEPLEANLSAGDGLIYNGGCKHWRNEFLGNYHANVFLHYVDINGPFKDEGLLYDTRPKLGLPVWTRKTPR